MLFNRTRVQKRKEVLTAYALILPTITASVLFFLYPIFYSVYLSFFQWDLLTPKLFVVLHNYIELFSADYFYETLGNTVMYSAGVTVLALGLGLGLALMVDRPAKAYTALQACIFSSYVVSWVAIALLWVWLLDPQYGLVNYLLGALGIKGQDWLGDTHLALMSLVLVSTWKIVGYSMIIYLAGLHTIPDEFNEACEIDGASAWQRFRLITWPLLSPMTMFLFITLTIRSFQAFDVVRLMTQGGPGHSTTIYMYFIYEQIFLMSMRMGYSSSAVVIFYAVIFLFTWVQFKVVRKRVHYM